MKKLIAMLLLITLMLCAAGCDTAGNTVFEGAKWDMSRAEVIEAIGEDKVTEGSSENILNWMLTEDLAHLYGERKVSVAFVFTQDKLASITVQIFANGGESVATAMTKTREAMDKVYGASEGTDDAAHWHTETSAINIKKVDGANSFFVALYSPITAHSH